MVHVGCQAEQGRRQLIQHLPVTKQKMNPLFRDAQFLSNRGLQEIHAITEVHTELEVAAGRWADMHLTPAAQPRSCIGS